MLASWLTITTANGWSRLAGRFTDDDDRKCLGGPYCIIRPERKSVREVLPGNKAEVLLQLEPSAAALRQQQQVNFLWFLPVRTGEPGRQYFTGVRQRSAEPVATFAHGAWGRDHDVHEARRNYVTSLRKSA
ncbi:unnamed protein product [Gadus morhua 'NCC']